MPGSHKVARAKEMKANREAGIGNEKGQIVRVKAPEVMVKCTVCGQELRMTKSNTEAHMHWTQKHPTNLFDSCFPGQTFTLKDGQADAKPKLDVDKVKAEAREAKSLEEGGVAKDEKKKKKKEDLSFLDAALK